MLSRWSFAPLMIIAMTLAGCAGGPSVAWNRSDKSLPGAGSAGSEGVYSLYEGGSKTPEWSGILGAGDHYGFRRTEDGTVVAFTEPYGNIPLIDRSAKSYYWKHDAEKKAEKVKRKNHREDAM